MMSTTFRQKLEPQRGDLSMGLMQELRCAEAEELYQ